MAVKADHVLDVPQTVFISRISQLVVAVVVMGLAAYGIYYLSFDAIDLTMFSAIATIIIAVYVIVASTAAPAAYNYWAIIALDSLMVLFWIVSFAYLAYEVASVQLVTYTYTDCLYEYAGVCYYKNKRSLEIAKRSTTVYTYRNVMAAAAGLGGLEFLLFVKTLVYTSIALHNHRKAGGHCVPSSLEAPPVEPQPMEAVPVQQPVYQQPQQVYQQQPVQPAYEQQQYQQQPVQPVYDQQQYQQEVYQQQSPQPVYQQEKVPQQVYQQEQPQPVYQQGQPQPNFQPEQQQPVYQQPQTYSPQTTYQPTA
jgi:hypothetical protein